MEPTRPVVQCDRVTVAARLIWRVRLTDRRTLEKITKNKKTGNHPHVRQKAAQLCAVVFPVVGVWFICWGFQHRNDPTTRIWGGYHVHWFDGVYDGAILCILGGIVFRQVFFKKSG